MKKVKFIIASLLFCTMSYVGYTTYKQMSISDAEKFMLANVEALTSGEGGVHVEGQKCSLRKGNQWCEKRKAYRKWVANYCIDIECD